MAGVVNRSFVGDDGQVPDNKTTTTTNGATPVASDTTVDTTSTGSGEREKWDNGVEFLLSCIAMSVGLGNVWKFPSTAFRNGGGAFVIPYMIVLLLVGRPVYYLEMVMGQFSSRGSVKVYDVSPVMREIPEGTPRGMSGGIPVGIFKEVPKKFLEVFLEKLLEESLEKLLEQFLEDILEEFMEKFLEEFLEDILEEFLENYLEDFLQATLEEFLKQALKTFLKGSLEELLLEGFMK
ncbi:hypothetical protein RP20_CCG028143 [Aedes albopictus]|nr:hypothetical protein RP20_CCG028143 [Aedes albopictus]